VEDHGRWHLQWLERIGGRLQVTSREVEIHRRVREVGVAEQDLDRAKVGPRFKEVRRVRVTQGVRRDLRVDASLLGGGPDSLPDHLPGERFVGTPAILRAREEIRLRSHPAPVVAERGEQRRAERHFTVVAPFSVLDAQHHALAVDVADFRCSTSLRRRPPP
jgi:hypothetical protein